MPMWEYVFLNGTGRDADILEAGYVEGGDLEDVWDELGAVVFPEGADRLEITRRPETR